MRGLGFHVSAALLVWAGCALAAGCSSQEQETSYKTLSAAESAGAVYRGWIPPWLPVHAHNLKEKHDLDTARSMVRFNFPAAEKWEVPSTCSQVLPSRIPGPGMAASWWPGDVPAPAIVTPRHAYFTCAGASEFLAVDFSGGEGFYWRVVR